MEIERTFHNELLGKFRISFEYFDELIYRK